MDAVQTVIENAMLNEIDPRGLMPLGQARALLAAATEFRRGETHIIEGVAVFDSDRLWAALLSLEDAEEFNREAKRLDWFFHPRSPLDAAAHKRFGDGIIDWLESCLLPNGVLFNVPCCVVAHLLAVGTPRAFHIANEARDVDHRQDPEFGPGMFSPDSPGDYDKYDLPPSPAGGAYSGEGHNMLMTWMDRHPGVAIPLLADIADPESTDDAKRRAAFIIKNVLAPNDHTWGAFRIIAEERGEDWTVALFERLDAPLP